LYSAVKELKFVLQILLKNTFMKHAAVSVLTVLSLLTFNPSNSQGTSAIAKNTVSTPSKIPYNVKTIALPGRVKLQYVEQGNAKGIPVIFLHGITDSWHSYETVLPLLPANIHAFAISQRGHGDSERPAEGYLPKDFADDVAAFIKEKKIGKAIIVGHSMGGFVAQQFAVLHPQLLKGLVIIGSDPAFTDNPGMPEFHQMVMELSGSIDYKFMDEFQKSTLSKPIDPDYYKTVVAEGMKVPARVFQAALTGMVGADLTKDIRKIQVPAIIFWGDKDGVCFRKDQDEFLKNIKGSKLVIYEGIGHALHWEEPARFAKDLVAFISSIR
jgi:non-heme chloroperoxidase